jgi:hypothetical protein
MYMNGLYHWGNEGVKFNPELGWSEEEKNTIIKVAMPDHDRQSQRNCYLRAGRLK